MPVRLLRPLRRLEEAEFARVAYEVMGIVFEVHREFGRFFDERVYKLELARCRADVELEFPIEVAFEPFCKTYYLDVLVGDGAAFEFESAEALSDRHRAQLLNYLLLCDLGHGKLFNVRRESVQHEFVNSTLRSEDRSGFDVDAEGWSECGDVKLREWLTELLHDVGAGLDLELYQDAVTELCGGEERVKQRIEVTSGGHTIATQRIRLVEPNVAFKITTLSDGLADFESHARRLLAHTRLDAIQWININRKCVALRTLHKKTQ
jgi:GxxExxY protein